jgi:chemotaxis protein MotD
MVTATLRFAGEQLSIELKVENQEAYRRLSADSDIIVNSLRELGYDIDRVTIVQPSAPAPGAKADASISMSPSQGRSAEQFGQGANDENAGSGGRSSGEDRSARHGGQQGSTLSQKKAAGGVYI